MAQPVDRSILQEIVRIIEARRKVPARVRVRAREYLLTYLEDHQNRLEEALQRYDSDRLNMLYGQLASRVKYQLLRRLPKRAKAAGKSSQASTAKRKSGATGAKRTTARPAAKPARKAATKAVKKRATKPAAAKKATRKPAAAKKAARKPAAVKKAASKPAAAKKAARKPAARKSAARAAAKTSARKKK